MESIKQYSEDHSPTHGIRPRFKFIIDDSVENISNKINNYIKHPDSPCIGKVVYGHAVLEVPKKDQHYWSPQLSLSIHENEDGEGTMIRGLYGPRPTVWTMFIFFYTAIGFASLIISIVGFSRMSLGKPSAILWFLPVLILIFLTLYLVANYGKKMGHDQMEILHHFVEGSLGVTIDAHEE